MSNGIQIGATQLANIRPPRAPFRFVNQSFHLMGPPRTSQTRLFAGPQIKMMASFLSGGELVALVGPSALPR